MTASARAKTHKYNYWITANPQMPDHVREQYSREGLKGTLCGYLRPSTTTEASEVTCFYCKHMMAKASEQPGKNQCI
jgi:hypothetical protein